MSDYHPPEILPRPKRMHHINTGGPCECCGCPEGHSCGCQPRELDALNAEIRRLESQNRAEALRLARAYGVIGQLAVQLADNYAHDFDWREIESGLEAAKVDDDGRHFRVSTMGS